MAVVRHHAREGALERVVYRRKDEARREHAARPALRHKDPPRVEFLRHHGLVEVVGIELVAGAAIHGIVEVADNDVEIGGVVAQAAVRVVVDELQPLVPVRGGAAWLPGVYAAPQRSHLQCVWCYSACKAARRQAGRGAQRRVRGTGTTKGSGTART